MKKIVKWFICLCISMFLLVPITASAQDSTSESEKTSEAVVKKGFHKDNDGKTRYYVNGKKSIGFKKIKGNYYYFSSNGVAKTGWITYNKYCYYFDKKTFAAKKNTIYDNYKLDKKGRSKTRYLIRKIVDKKTNSKMSKKRKINVLWKYVIGNSWKYKRTYEHLSRKWKWKKGWQDDYANDLLTTGKGNCFRYAAVLGYLIQEATGYKVRVYHGMTIASRGGLIPHGWITVRMGKKWYAYDPDLYKFGSHSSQYYKKLYSHTKYTIHRRGKYVTLK